MVTEKRGQIDFIPGMLKVAYHEGGLLFAGEAKEYATGWYLFTGLDAYPISVDIKNYAQKDL